MNEAKAIDSMRAWFFDNFEDPVDCCPYESAEGGYYFIWGGPFDAREQLHGRFSGSIRDEWIDALADELELRCAGWSGSSDQNRYQDELVERILSVTDPHKEFVAALSDVELLMDQSVDINVQPKLNQLLFVNVVTALETYLLDALASAINTRPEVRRRFVETCLDFKQKKIELSSIYAEYENLRALVNNYLTEVAWHNLSRVRAIYSGAFDTKFPEPNEQLYAAVQTRHDIVHRNGRNRKGEPVGISSESLARLTVVCREFVSQVDALVVSTTINPDDLPF